MTKFLAGVLSVIPAGVLLIAYGLLSPQASAFDMRTQVDQFGRPIVPNAGMMPAAHCDAHRLRDDAGLRYLLRTAGRDLPGSAYRDIRPSRMGLRRRIRPCSLSSMRLLRSRFAQW